MNEADVEELVSEGELLELSRIEGRATAGPWEWYNGCSWWRLGTREQHDAVISPEISSDGHPNLSCSQYDREFVVAARDAMPRLIKTIQSLQSPETTKQAFSGSTAMQMALDMKSAGLFGNEPLVVDARVRKAASIIYSVMPNIDNLGQDE